VLPKEEEDNTRQHTRIHRGSARAIFLGIEKGEIRQLDVSLTARLSLVLGLGIDLLYPMGDETIRAEVDGSGFLPLLLSDLIDTATVWAFDVSTFEFGWYL